MKPIFTILVSFLLIPMIQAQNEWSEHLSHDRTAYAHHGHFVDLFGGLTLKMGNHTSPMNTTERIYGPEKNGVFWEGTDLNPASEVNEYSYQTLRLGEDQNQVTLKAPSYDNILGHGVHSIIQTNLQNLSLRKIDNPEIDQLNIIDVAFQNSQFVGTYFTTDENKLYRLDFGYTIDWIEDFEGDLKLHNGLNNYIYRIHDGVFSNIDTPNEGSVFLGDYDKLDNNPFNNELIEFEQSTVNRYSFLDFSLTRSEIINGLPIDYLFVGDGFYYLTETDLSYWVYFFSDETSQSEIYYELPKNDEIQDFKVSEFNIRGNEIFFMGLWKSPQIGENFSYVQRRSINEEYVPERKDLEISNMLVTTTPAGQNGQFTYSYSCTVANLSSEPINHFTLYSERLDLFDSVSDQFIKNDISKELAPGESMEVIGSFDYSSLSSLTFHIAGVDFGIDSDMSNNSFTLSLGIVSSKDIVANEYNIFPNPTTNYISIEGDVKNIESIFIFDLIGNKLNIPVINASRVNTSNLPVGQYWLQINGSSKTEIQSFVKK